MAKKIQDSGAAIEPPSILPKPNLRSFYAKGIDGLTSPDGVQYNAADGIVLLPADQSWYSMYIDCGWLEEKLG